MKKDKLPLDDPLGIADEPVPQDADDIHASNNPDEVARRRARALGEDVETGTWREVQAPPVATNYERFAAAVRSSRTLEPSFRHAANLQKILDLATVTDRERREMATA